MNIIGPQIRRIRFKLGLTQNQLATKCQLIGLDITRGTLAKIESNLRTVTDIEIMQIAKALKVSVSDLYPKKK